LEEASCTAEGEEKIGLASPPSFLDGVCSVMGAIAEIVKLCCGASERVSGAI
jgi:hypothetical protein